MYLSRQTIRKLNILTPCHDRFVVHGMTAGLGATGYDLQVEFGVDLALDQPSPYRIPIPSKVIPNDCKIYNVAAMEHFNMPLNVLGLVCDKSTWARFPKGLVVQNTVIEPGWCGYLTLELTNHGVEGEDLEDILLRRGMPIAQVVFCFLDQHTDLSYMGKYQNQLQGPQKAK